MPDQPITLALSDIVIAFQIGNESFKKDVEKNYAAFLSHQTAEYHIEIANHQVSKDQEKNYPMGKSDISMALSDKDEISCDQEDWLEGRLNLNTNKGKFKIAPFIKAFDYLLRILFSDLLLRNQAFLFHSASMVLDEKGICFFGKEDAGKTTVARQFSSDFLLSDDVVLVQKEEDGSWKLYKTPFSGELENGFRENQADLTRLYCLKKNENFSLSRGDSKEALFSILECVILFSKNESFGDLTMSLIPDLLADVELYTMDFSLDHNIPEKISDHLKV